MITLLTFPARALRGALRDRSSTSATSGEVGTTAGADPSEAAATLKKEIAARDALARRVFEDIDACKEVDLDQLRGVKGVRFSATTWAELGSLLADGTPEAIAQLGRSPLALKFYWDSLRDLKEDWASVADCLLHSVFGLPSYREADRVGSDGEASSPGAPGPPAGSCSADGGKRRTPIPADFGSRDRIVWRRNDFPYWFEHGIRHDNVWCNRPLRDEEVEAVIDEYRPSGAYETLWFKNPPALQSVPQLWHVHVLSRPREGTEEFLRDQRALRRAEERSRAIARAHDDNVRDGSAESAPLAASDAPPGEGAPAASRPPERGPPNLIPAAVLPRGGDLAPPEPSGDPLVK